MALDTEVDLFEDDLDVVSVRLPGWDPKRIHRSERRKPTILRTVGFLFAAEDGGFEPEREA